MIARFVGAMHFSLLGVLAAATVFANPSLAEVDRPARLVVQLGSHCCGPDSESLGELQRYLREYDAKYNRRIAYTILSWGKEGDLTYCLTLSELSQADQKDFVERMRKLEGERPSGGGWTRVFENAHCTGIGPIRGIQRVE